MKKTLAVIFAGFMLTIASGVFAADIKVGVVDLNKIVTESPEGKKANDELQALIKSRQAAVDELGAKIESLQKDIRAEKDAGKKKAREADLTKFSVEHQTLAQNSQAEIQRKMQELRSELLKDIKKAVDSVGDEDKFTLILFTSEMVPYFQKTIDITDKVAKKHQEMKKAKK